MDLGDPSSDEDAKCFCDKECTTKNVFNVGPCISVPIRLSLPHFYGSDPHYLEMVEGLNPERVSDCLFIR